LASLLVVVFAESDAQVSQKLLPIDDAYVINDYNHPDAKLLPQLNTGDLPRLKIWYTWNSTNIQEQVLSIGYLKFDVSDLELEKIQSATLKMYPFKITKSSDSNPVGIYMVDNIVWTESQLNFDNRPGYFSPAIITTEINSENQWYEWDLTETIKENTNPQISFSVVIDTLFVNQEEQFVFYSKDSSTDFKPYLEIAYQSTTPFEYSNDTKIGIIVLGLIAAVIGVIILLYTIKKKRSKLSKIRQEDLD